MDKTESYLELAKAQISLQDEYGVYKTLEHRQAKFKIKILDVFLNIETEDEILVSSQRIDNNQKEIMPLRVLKEHYIYVR